MLEFNSKIQRSSADVEAHCSHPTAANYSLTKTSFTLKAACGLERFVQLTSRERACDLGKPLGGKREKKKQKREKSLPRINNVPYSERKNLL